MKQALVRLANELDTLTLIVAMLLVAVGFWNLWRPGAFILPGAVLLWLALPTRRPFIDRQPAELPARRKD